jgi:hypothetical protein
MSTRARWSGARNGGASSLVGYGGAISCLAIALAACQSTGPGMWCDVAEDCADGLVCFGGVCTPCHEDAICGEGLVCIAGLCTGGCAEDGGCDCPLGTSGCKCRPDEGCDSDLACFSDVCVPCIAGAQGCACTPDPEARCVADLVCAGAKVCLPPDTCGVLRDAGLCPIGRRCTMLEGLPQCSDECDVGYVKGDAGACVPEPG